MKDAFILQQARAKTTAFMARAANEPDFMQATAGHITSLHVDLAHERDKTARLERQVNAMGVLKLRLAEAISGETLSSNFILDSIGEDFNAARTLRRHTAEWRKKILERYGEDVRKAASVIEHLHSQLSPAAGSSAPTTELAFAGGRQGEVSCGTQVQRRQGEASLPHGLEDGVCAAPVLRERQHEGHVPLLAL